MFKFICYYFKRCRRWHALTKQREAEYAALGRELDRVVAQDEADEIRATILRGVWLDEGEIGRPLVSRQREGALVSFDI